MIQLNPIIEGLLNTLNKGHPYCTQRKLRYHLAGHLLCADNDKDIYLLSITRRFLTDVQTDAQNVPVDDNTLIRKLTVMLM